MKLCALNHVPVYLLIAWNILIIDERLFWPNCVPYIFILVPCKYKQKFTAWCRRQPTLVYVNIPLYDLYAYAAVTVKCRHSNLLRITINHARMYEGRKVGWVTMWGFSHCKVVYYMFRVCVYVEFNWKCSRTALLRAYGIWVGQSV